jgi:hypothetical protein
LRWAVRRGPAYPLLVPPSAPVLLLLECASRTFLPRPGSRALGTTTGPSAHVVGRAPCSVHPCGRRKTTASCGHLRAPLLSHSTSLLQARRSGWISRVCWRRLCPVLPVLCALQFSTVWVNSKKDRTHPLQQCCEKKTKITTTSYPRQRLLVDREDRR